MIIDEGVPYDISHPFHLHGHNFFVVAMERHAANASHIGAAPYPGNSIRKRVSSIKHEKWELEFSIFLSTLGKDDVIAMDNRKEIKRNLVNPPIKDSVVVPDGGFTIIRFLADNPGYWLVHCHMSWHNHLGMGFILKERRMLDAAF